MLERLSSSYKHIPLVTGRMRGVRIIIQGTPYCSLFFLVSCTGNIHSKSTGRVHRLKKLSGPVFPSVV